MKLLAALVAIFAPPIVLGALAYMGNINALDAIAGTIIIWLIMGDVLSIRG